MEALRYPADYDGIIAGAPVNFRTHQLTWELWVSHAVHRDAASYFPPAKYPAIHQAALDGRKDRSHSTAVRVSGSGALHGYGQHR